MFVDNGVDLIIQNRYLKIFTDSSYNSEHKDSGFRFKVLSQVGESYLWLLFRFTTFRAEAHSRSVTYQNTTSREVCNPASFLFLTGEMSSKAFECSLKFLFCKLEGHAKFNQSDIKTCYFVERLWFPYGERDNS